MPVVVSAQYLEKALSCRILFSCHSYLSIELRDALIDHKLQSVADQLCDGSLAPLLTHLVKGQRLKGKELRELRGLLDQLDQKRGRKS